MDSGSASQEVSLQQEVQAHLPQAGHGLPDPGLEGAAAGRSGLEHCHGGIGVVAALLHFDEAAALQVP